MRVISITRRERSDGKVGLWVRISRVALLLTGLLVLVMPLTEYLWNFDHFLRDGQDIELGLFSVAMVMCLVLMMLQRGSQGFLAILAVRILAVRDRIFTLFWLMLASTPTRPCERGTPFAGFEFCSPALTQQSLPILV